MRKITLENIGERCGAGDYRVFLGDKQIGMLYREFDRTWGYHWNFWDWSMLTPEYDFDDAFTYFLSFEDAKRHLREVYEV